MKDDLEYNAKIQAAALEISQRPDPYGQISIFGIEMAESFTEHATTKEHMQILAFSDNAEAYEGIFDLEQQTEKLEELGSEGVLEEQAFHAVLADLEAAIHTLKTTVDVWDKEARVATQMTVAEILELINTGHSDDWIAYDTTDWQEGTEEWLHSLEIINTHTHTHSLGKGE
jgi:hypothetical protein